MKTDELLSKKVRELPHRPGVYIYKDRLGRIIYVGKARDLKKRVSQYFHPSREMRSDRKTQALLTSIRDFDFHVVNSEAEALLLEGKLIKEYRPRFNISFRDDKRFLMVRVNVDDPIPKFQLTRMRKEDGARYFGPFVDSVALRKTLKVMQNQFTLRMCSPLLPTERDYKHCLDHIIKKCPAPCIGKISREDYHGLVQKACDFLEGKSKETVAELEREMMAAAGRHDFERAAGLRDLAEDLRRTTQPMKRFIRTFQPKIDGSQDVLELQQALKLEVLPQVMECFDISNISTTHKVASMVCFRGGRPDKASYRRYRIVGVEGQDDFASIAEAVRRRYSRVLTEGIRKPDLIIVDGGKGQLSSALAELKVLGLGALPLIGLAKENEEIYRSGISEPLILSRASGALKLLQRIRDEAHRFANGYHQLLLKQRISESALDECPGVSPARKIRLLNHFGSVSKLKKATVAEIGAVEGIGPKTAVGIWNYFHPEAE